jgi:hypothetical protein
MQKMEEIVEQLRILKTVQQTFIDCEEWTEVSKVQFDIDELKSQKERAKPWKPELWFQVALWEHVVIPRLRAFVAQDIYTLKTYLRVKGE